MISRRIVLGDVVLDVQESLDDDYSSYTWPCALILCQYILSANLKGSALEIGCGTGLVSLVLVRLGLDVLATDASSQALTNVIASAQSNQLSLSTRILNWNDPDTWDLASGTNYIFGSDVFYDPQDFPNILSMIASLLKQCPKETIFVTAYQERSSKRSISADLARFNLGSKQISTKNLREQLSLSPPGLDSVFLFQLWLL